MFSSNVLKNTGPAVTDDVIISQGIIHITAGGCVKFMVTGSNDAGRLALEAIAVEGQPLVPDVIVSTPQSINNRKEKTKMNIISRFIIVFVMALSLAFTALVPQDAHAQDCFVTPFTGIAQQKQSTKDCLVLIASSNARSLLFLDDLNFQEDSSFAPWENTTMQSGTGRPIDVYFEGVDQDGQPRTFDVWFRTLTLRDVNFDPKGFGLKWPFASDTALTLENASVILEPKPLWPSTSPLTLEAVSGDNIIERLKGNLDAPTTLTVAGGTTFKFADSGSVMPNLPDSSRCNFNADANSADIEGVLELRGSWVIFTMTGGGEMLVHNGGKLLMSTSSAVLEARGNLRVDGGSIEMVRNSTIFVDDLELSNASLLIEGEANIRSGVSVVRDDSTVTLGSTRWDSGALLFADDLLVDNLDTLNLAGYGAVSTQQLFLAPGAQLRITESTRLFINGPASNNWFFTDSSIEIGPEAFLQISSGGNVSSVIPIHNDGTFRVYGTFNPIGQMSGDGLLQVSSTGTLALGGDAGDTFTASPEIIMDALSTFRPLINPTAGQAQKLIASTSITLSTLVGVYLEPIILPFEDVVLAPGTQFVIVEFPEGNDLQGLFMRDDLTKLRDGDEITLGLNTYRINYNPTNITLTVPDPARFKANDDYYTALQNQDLVVPAPGVLGNDLNVTGTPVVVTSPMYGAVTLNPDGSFTYTPDSGFDGDDSFTYKWGTGGTASNIATVYIHVRAQEDCTLTQGYWKTHAGSGGARLDTTWLELPEAFITPFFLSGETYLEVLAREPEGNAYYILAQQYIAAELNFLRGADPSAVQTEFDEAKALFEQFTPADAAALEPADRQYWITLALILDRYNNGDLGPGACPEEGPSG